MSRYREQQTEACGELRRHLGTGGVFEEVADMARDLIRD